jgi:hypothetical protein
MILATFFIIAWMISACYWMLPKHFSFIDVLILWFLNSIAIVSLHTILSLNWYWISISENIELFLSFLLIRSIIDPMLLLIFENIFYHTLKAVWKTFTAIGILTLFLVIEFLSVRLHIVTFITFNYFYAGLMYVLFLVFSHLIAHFLRYGGTYANHRL